ncbi:MAG: hypothetical protein U1C19_01595 [Methanobacteriaceae archaeon]|nr:hypothetical protein [Methanobacteriaceae archaeon]
MVNEIDKIYDYIDNLEDCDQDMKRFLKAAVLIEFKNEKENIIRYKNDYKSFLNSIFGNIRDEPNEN